jgi:uncharacterized protein (TIGR02001 family)
MNKKTTPVVLSAALLLGTFSAFGDTPPVPAPTPVTETPASTLTVTPAVVSQYMFRGSRLSGPAFEPTIEYGAGNLILGVWANFPIRDKVPGQSDPEIDPYGSYTITINKDLNIAPGFTWYNFPRAEKSNGFYKMTFEPNLALNYTTTSGFKLTPKLYYDVVLKGPTYELTGFFALPLKDAGTELDFTATIGTFKWTDAFEDTTPSVKNWGNYWLVGVAAPFQITPKSKITIGLAYSKGSDNYLKQGSSPRFENSLAVGRGIVSIAYAYTF